MGCRSRRLALLSLVAVVSLLAAACGDDSDDTGASDSPGTTTAATPTSAGSGDADYSDVRVGMVYDITGKGDGSFNDSAYAGLSRAADELGVEVRDIEPSSAGEARQENMELLAGDGYGLVFGVGFLFEEPTTNIVDDYPDTHFAVIDSGVPDVPNATGIVFAANEGSFLVGAAAGLKTKSDKVGFVGAQPGALIGAFEAGFTAGVKHVNPDAEVAVQYISEDANVAFTDDTRANEIANAMIEDGADILYHAAGTAGSGMFRAVKAANDAGNEVWAIGVDSDQASPDLTTVEDEYKPFIMTSMLKRIDNAVFDAIKAFAEGSLAPGFVTYDLAGEGVGYSTTGGHIDDIVDQLEELKQEIIDGTIKVAAEP